MIGVSLPSQGEAGSDDLTQIDLEFLAACDRCDRVGVEELIEQVGSTVIGAGLVQSAEYGCAEIVELLLCCTEERYQVEALKLAGEQGHIEVVKAMMNHDPSLATADRYGKSAIWIAIERASNDIVDLLISHTPHDTLARMLSMAWQSDRAEVIHVLAPHVDTGKVDAYLAYAAGQGKLLAVAALLPYCNVDKIWMARFVTAGLRQPEAVEMMDRYLASRRANEIALAVGVGIDDPLRERRRRM